MLEDDVTSQIDFSQPGNPAILSDVLMLIYRSQIICLLALLKPLVIAYKPLSKNALSERGPHETIESILSTCLLFYIY